MRFLTATEAASWSRGRSMLMPFGDRPERQPGVEPRRYSVPPAAAAVYALSSYLVSTMAPDDSSLLWITEYGIWPSTENTHAYYRVRESYGDHRLLHEAPAGLFLNHESDDLATSLWFALLFGWDACLMPDSDHLAVYLSHDGFFELYSRSAEQSGVIEARLAELKVTPRT